jgi:hypothetical protein
VAFAALTAQAQASTVTVGSPLSATPAVREFGLPATVFNPALIETDAHVSSPVDGR